MLARHSRDFLDGKKEVEKDRAALQAHAEELEDRLAAMGREARDRARQQREQTTAFTEQQVAPRPQPAPPPRHLHPFPQPAPTAAAKPKHPSPTSRALEGLSPTPAP